MDADVILIGLGANLPTARYGAPRKTLEAALEALERRGIHVVKLSRWYSSAPVPPSSQPRYVNAVAAVRTDLPPEALLGALHEIERDLGRRRAAARNAARAIDLDLLAYGTLVRSHEAPLLPHPRLAERAFVLRPLCDIAPHWRHPTLGQTAQELAAALSSADVRACEAQDG